MKMDSNSAVSVWSMWHWADILLLLVFFIFFLILGDFFKNRRTGSFPPGPRMLPLVGNIFTVDFSRAHMSLTELSEKYGDVYSMRLGQSWTVVLNGFKAVKEALVTQADCVADRPFLHLEGEDICNHKGLVFCSGHLWKQQRRFALSTLKYFGVGKKSLEPAVLDEFTHLAKHFSEHQGRPFQPHFAFQNAVSNIICSLVFGHRFEYTDEKLRYLIGKFDRALQLHGSIWAQLYNSFPTLMRHLPGPHNTILHIWNEVKDLIREEIQEHKKSCDPMNPRDYIDCYLTEITKSKGDVDSTFDEENLVICCLNLFAAGTETTSSTLRWSLLYMAKYPEIQEKVQEEIDRVIGWSRLPCMADQTALPYTSAVIHEIQRMANIVPLSLPHMTTRDVQLGGYTVPKGVTIIPNLTSVLFDPHEWATPFTFNPGHFLSEDGSFVRPAAFLPFSAGKRVCLGENLARMELFLFFSSLMQRFRFSMPAGVKPTLECHFGLTLAPIHYNICASLRHHQ